MIFKILKLQGQETNFWLFLTDIDGNLSSIARCKEILDNNWSNSILQK